MKKGTLLLKILVSIVLAIFIFMKFGSFKNELKNIYNDIYNRPAQNENNTAMSLKNKIEELCDICSAEYEYNTIVADKQTGILGIRLKSNIIMSKGKIKAGCKMIDFEKQGDKYIVTLSKPYIIDSGASITREIPKESFFSNYELKDDKNMVDKIHKQIEDRVKDELFSTAEKNTKDIIFKLLDNMSIDIGNVDFKFTANS